MVIPHARSLVFAIPTPHPNRLRAFKRAGLSRVSDAPSCSAPSNFAPLRRLVLARTVLMLRACHLQTGPVRVGEGALPTPPPCCQYMYLRFQTSQPASVPHAHTRAHTVRWLVPPARASFSRKEVAPASGRVQSWVCVQCPSRRLPGRPQPPSRPPPGRGLRPRPEV